MARPRKAAAAEADDAAAAPDAKVVVTFRITREGRDFIDKQARANGADDRSMQMKAMLAVAARHPREVREQVERAKQMMTARAAAGAEPAAE